MNKFKTESKSEFFANYLNEEKTAQILWDLKRKNATYITETNNDEFLSGDNLEIDEEKVFELTDAYASTKEPYGSVHYCDEGMQSDKKKRFPVNTKARVKAALSYSHHKNVMSKYTTEQLAKLHACIARAYKKFFGEEPPSMQK